MFQTDCLPSETSNLKVKTRHFVPTTTELLYGAPDREPAKIYDPAIKAYFKRMESQRTARHNAKEDFQTDRNFPYERICSPCREKFLKTEEIKYRGREAGALLHVCPLDGDLDGDYPDQPMDMVTVARIMASPAIPSDEVLPLLAEVPTDSEMDERRGSDADNSTSVIVALPKSTLSVKESPSGPRLASNTKETPSLLEKALTRWTEDDFSDEDGFIPTKGTDVLRKYSVFEDSEMEEFGKKIESKGYEEENKRTFKEISDENLHRQTENNLDTGSLNGPNAMSNFRDANIGRRGLDTSDLDTFEHKEDDKCNLQLANQGKHQNDFLEIFQQISSQSSNSEKPQNDFPEIGQQSTPQSSGYQQQRKKHLLQIEDDKRISQSCAEENVQSSSTELTLKSPSVDKIVNVVSEFSPDFMSGATFRNTTSETTAVRTDICQKLRDEAETIKTVGHASDKMKHRSKLPGDESSIGEFLEIETNVHAIEDSFNNSVNERREDAFTDYDEMPKSEVSSKSETGRKKCLFTMEPAAKNLLKKENQPFGVATVLRFTTEACHDKEDCKPLESPKVPSLQARLPARKKATLSATEFVLDNLDVSTRSKAPPSNIDGCTAFRPVLKADKKPVSRPLNKFTKFFRFLMKKNVFTKAERKDSRRTL